jgi:hypothetical protein
VLARSDDAAGADALHRCRIAKQHRVKVRCRHICAGVVVRYAIVHVCAARAVEYFAGDRITGVVGDVIGHHDDDTRGLEAAPHKHLVRVAHVRLVPVVACMQGSLWHTR